MDDGDKHPVRSLDAQMLGSASVIVEVDDPDAVVSLYLEGGHLGSYDVVLLAVEQGAEVVIRGRSDNG